MVELRSEHETETGPDSPEPGPPAEQARSAPAGEVAEIEDRWRRALADLDNLRKRHAREVPRERAAERERVAAEFLPVLDNIDLALRHAKADPSAIVEGVRAVRDQAVAVLARLGYELQDEAGVPFDPARHEVVAVVPPDEGTSPGLVVDVVRPGYGGPERQLRPAAVTVSRNPGS